MAITIIDYKESVSDPNVSEEVNYQGIKRVIRRNNVYAANITCLVTSSGVALNDLKDLIQNSGNYFFFPDPENATTTFASVMKYVTVLPSWQINPYGMKNTNIVSFDIVETRD